MLKCERLLAFLTFQVHAGEITGVENINLKLAAYILVSAELSMEKKFMTSWSDCPVAHASIVARFR